MASRLHSSKFIEQINNDSDWYNNDDLVIADQDGDLHSRSFLTQHKIFLL